MFFDVHGHWDWDELEVFTMGSERYKFKLVQTGEIPENVRRVQEKLGFAPGEIIDHKKFRRLIEVKCDDGLEIEDGNEVRNPKNVITKVEKVVSGEKFDEVETSKKRMLSKNVITKVEKVVSGKKFDEMETAKKRMLSAKEKAYNNWGPIEKPEPKKKKNVENVTKCLDSNKKLQK